MAELKEDWIEAKGGKEVEEKNPVVVQRDSPRYALQLLRGLFKADHPYRTKLSLHSNVGTSGSGVINTQLAMSLVNTTGEWSSIDVLFNEFYVHSACLTFLPYNKDGTTPAGTTNGSFSQTVATTVSQTITEMNMGVVLVSIFGSPAYYTGAQAMSNNPSRKIAHSSEKFKYFWRNNVKFDPHGITLGPLTAVGWQGWTTIADSANIGGAMQMRAVGDIAVGNAASAYNLGAYELQFDVSFRARA